MPTPAAIIPTMPRRTRFDLFSGSDAALEKWGLWMCSNAKSFPSLRKMAPNHVVGVVDFRRILELIQIETSSNRVSHSKKHFGSNELVSFHDIFWVLNGCPRRRHEVNKLESPLLSLTDVRNKDRNMLLLFTPHVSLQRHHFRSQ